MVISAGLPANEIAFEPEQLKWAQSPDQTGQRLALAGW